MDIRCPQRMSHDDLSDSDISSIVTMTITFVALNEMAEVQGTLP